MKWEKIMATIQDFELLKTQLAELANIVNAFNSEAVQLKIVEIILSEHMTSASHISHVDAPKVSLKNKKPSFKTKVLKTDNGETKKTKSKSTGPTTILSNLIEEGFFSKRQTINNIIDHVKIQKATSLKANEISTPLGRLVRDGKLKREKNSDGQYEYFS